MSTKLVMLRLVAFCSVPANTNLVFVAGRLATNLLVESNADTQDARMRIPQLRRATRKRGAVEAKLEAVDK
jgi:hypothetical protein